MLKITMLGSGTSSGVPVIGCRCATCTSADPRDTRLRSSLWLQTDAASIIFDTSSDFRQQCLRQNIDRLDAVVYTHQHYDHVSGFDDLRAFNYLLRKNIPVYLTAETLGYLKTVFGYAFTRDPANMSSRPLVSQHLISNQPFMVGDATILPLDLMHGNMPVKGFRINSFAYCTDCNMIPDQTMERLQGLDVLILDGLRVTEHPTHFTFDQAVQIARKIGAKQTHLTHIAHDLRHREIEELLPEGINAGYDGLEIIIR